MILSQIANGMILVRPSVLPTILCLKKVCYKGQVDTDQDKPVWAQSVSLGLSKTEIYQAW